MAFGRNGRPFRYKVSGSFDSLSKVLFNFPSQYLFAIGLTTLFSLGWNIPPASDCTLKQPYSTVPQITDTLAELQDYHLLWSSLPTEFTRQSAGLYGLIPHISAQKLICSIRDGLVHFRSPILMESRLISFLPANDMLKFTGCSYLI
jgi:hypothetical protein